MLLAGARIHRPWALYIAEDAILFLRGSGAMSPPSAS